LTGLPPTANGWPDQTREEEDSRRRAPVVRDLERRPWSLGHGTVFKALPVVQAVAMDRDAAGAPGGPDTARHRLKAVAAFHPSSANHPGCMPN